MRLKNTLKLITCSTIFITGLYPLTTIAQCDQTGLQIYLDNESSGNLALKMIHADDNASFNPNQPPPVVLSPASGGAYPHILLTNNHDGLCGSGTIVYGSEATIGNIPTCKFTVTFTGAHDAYNVEPTAVSNSANTSCTVGKVSEGDLSSPILIIDQK